MLSLLVLKWDRGGLIIFGVKDSPKEVVGLSKSSKFHEIKTELFDDIIKSYSSRVPRYRIGSFMFDSNLEIGYIEVLEEKNKPVICTKHVGKDLKEGSIYYRYNGKSEVISYGELDAIIQDLKEKERKGLLSNVQTILKYGPENTKILRTDNGEIAFNDNVKVVVDDKLLSEIRKEAYFIDSGRISEDGDKTIKVVGSIEAAPINEVVKNPNQTHPYRTKDIASNLGVRPHDILVLIWKHGLKGDQRYHIAHNNGANALHKYSRETEDYLAKFVRDREYIAKVKKEYAARMKNNRK